MNGTLTSEPGNLTFHERNLHFGTSRNRFQSFGTSRNRFHSFGTSRNLVTAFPAAAPNHPEALLEEPQAFQAVGEKKTPQTAPKNPPLAGPSASPRPPGSMKAESNSSSDKCATRSARPLAFRRGEKAKAFALSSSMANALNPSKESLFE